MIIYAIEKENLIVYIGQTRTSLAKRKSSHLSLLRNKKHYNNELQNLFNEDFNFIELAQASSEEELNQLELYYIDKYKDQIVNKPTFRQPTAESSLKSAKTRTKYTQEELIQVLKKVLDGETITSAIKDTNINMNAFNGVVNQGRVKHMYTGEAKELIDKYKARHYNYIDPTQKVHLNIKNLSKFAKEQGIEPKILYQLNKGVKKVQGWTTYPPPKGVKPGITTLQIEGPDKQIYTVTNQKEFEIEHNLHARAVTKIKKGKTVKGYKLFTNQSEN